MTIEVHGHIESMAVGPLNMTAITIRIESSRARELLTILANQEEIASNLYRPGKGITIRLWPAP